MSADNLAGFTSLTQEMRCQLFVSGIRDPAFEACKAHVIAQGTMMSDFSVVKTYFTNYARQRAFQNPLPPPCNFSTVSSRGGHVAGRGAGRGQDRGCGAGRRDKGGYHGTPPTDEELAASNVTVRDYSEDEYSKLTSIQQYKLQLLRRTNDSTCSSGTCRPASIISSVSNSVADTADEVNNMQIDDRVTVGSNRNHAVLARQAEAKRARTD